VPKPGFVQLNFIRNGRNYINKTGIIPISDKTLNVRRNGFASIIVGGGQYKEERSN
jgi:hypothetical protein